MIKLQILIKNLLTLRNNFKLSKNNIKKLLKKYKKRKKENHKIK